VTVSWLETEDTDQGEVETARPIWTTQASARRRISSAKVKGAVVDCGKWHPLETGLTSPRRSCERPARPARRICRANRVPYV